MNPRARNMAFWRLLIKGYCEGPWLRQVAYFGVVPNTNAILTTRRELHMYRVESIGAQFSKTGREALEARLSALEREGWSLHSTFAVTETSCLGLSKQQSNFMILQKPD